MAKKKSLLKKRPAKKPSRRTRATPVPQSNGASPDPPTSRLLPKPGQLIVRMYRQGLGDCFLLAFGTDNENDPRYVLIDCGVHSRQSEGPARLLKVMNHLAASTGNHLHVVVATHEHADHLSGFVQKGSPFLRDDLTIDELWVAWTEKVGNEQADRLRKKHAAARKVINKAVEEARRRAAPGVSAALADELLGLTDFERPAEDSVDPASVERTIQSLANQSPERKAALAELQQRLEIGSSPVLGAAKKKTEQPSSNELALGLLTVKADNKTYCDPKKTPPLTIPNVAAARAYVLGPPRDETLLKKDLPSKIRGSSSEDGHGKYKEVYLTGQAETRALELSPALGAASDLGEINDLPDDLRYPFVSAFRRKFTVSGQRLMWDDSEGPPKETKDFIAEHYLGAGTARAAKNGKADSTWRRIDGDWLGTAEQLALNLDSDTNNTSLVLAFEWGAPGRGQILLFAADAQVGNWLSWRDQKYKTGDTSQTADELLARTILYKVGHHGSHNATVKRDPRKPTASQPLGVPFGLELMENIIALIPVDRASAEKKMPTPWEMPHLPLYRRLREKAHRRVLRSDLSLEPLKIGDDPSDITPPSPQWQAIPGLKGLHWRRSPEEFEKPLGTEGPLYYDILFPPP